MWREEASAWSQQDELLACLIETTAAWGQQMVGALIAVHGGKPKRAKPLRIEHPDRPKPEAQKKKALSVADFEKQLNEKPPS